MMGKEKILDAWIMVEHLSEGDIQKNSNELYNFSCMREGDYYTFLIQLLAKRCPRDYKKAGLVIYFDIFPFAEVLHILRKKYRLSPTYEEISVGYKFRFALYFDRALNLQSELSFFTESAYIKEFNEVPNEEVFRDYEKENRLTILRMFENVKEPVQFNASMAELVEHYNICIEDSRIKYVNNLDADITNLHSFFIEDLSRAKELNTENLKAYLMGNAKDRIHLDSKRESENFAPHIFEKILEPKNYPLGRFPSNTLYKPSFMQQVAINLACGYDKETIRSVNGPPGTGKTTLLKDIFAELIVQQAKDILDMQTRIGKDKELNYYMDATIRELPDYLTEKGIVVASTNNAALQNIVNELPLLKDIDKNLQDELKKADYFRELANSKVEEKWEKNEEGKPESFICIERKPEDVFWGLVSLEGGKASNVSNILTHIKAMYNELSSEYFPQKDVYERFFKQYRKVERMRMAGEEVFHAYQGLKKRIEDISLKKNAYPRERYYKEMSVKKKIEELKEIRRKREAEASENRLQIQTFEKEEAELKKKQEQLQAMEDLLKIGKPSWFNFVGRCRYSKRVNDLVDKLLTVVEEESQLAKKKRQSEDIVAEIESQKKESQEKEKELIDELHYQDTEFREHIQAQEKKIQDLKRWLDRSHVLDMTLEYDQLQVSNPWFDIEYRKEQSKLFILALEVRKQFLYENKKNLKAAVNIWNHSKSYLEKRRLIAAAWGWINLAIPIISSTFASFSYMFKYLDKNVLGHLFIDEAGQALPQAGVGAVFRSRHVMAVGDPLQIKPVLTLDSAVLGVLRKKFEIDERYLDVSASIQTLVDAAGKYGFYRERDKSPDSWIGIPLWVHRRCRNPMFTISNTISYNGFMVQAISEIGKSEWFDIKGSAFDKYVEEQGDFVAEKIREMASKNPKILDKNEEDTIYVISPFTNVAYQLSQRLREIDFTRYKDGKPTNVGTIHTFQGKEADVVFMVLGADNRSKGSAKWAVSASNMMNVAVTRAKKEFYIVGDKDLYLKLACPVAEDTYKIIKKYQSYLSE